VTPLERLFGKWLKKLAPGLPNPSQAIQTGILYRSAQDKKQTQTRVFKGDSMDVDLGDFTIPLEG
jgi:hypothetical protein